VATCYDGSPVAGQELSLFGEDDGGGDTLVADNNGARGQECPRSRCAYKIEITEVPDMNGDGAVDMTADIPMDYPGVMGVPITFMDKYNPEQFEIIGITKTWFGMASKIYPEQTQVDKRGKETTVSKLNDGSVLSIPHPLVGKTYYIVDGKYYIQTYARILIRAK